MEKILVTIILLCIIHSGSLDDNIYPSNYVPTNEFPQTLDAPFWPFPVAGTRRASKPCNKKLKTVQPDNEWAQSFRAQIKPSMNYQSIYDTPEMQTNTKQSENLIQYRTPKLRELTTENSLRPLIQESNNKVIVKSDWNISEVENNNEKVDHILSDINNDKIKHDHNVNTNNDLSLRENSVAVDDTLLNNQSVDCDPTSEEENGRRTIFDNLIFYVKVPKKGIKCSPVNSNEDTRNEPLDDNNKKSYRKKFDPTNQILESNKKSIDKSGNMELNDETIPIQRQDLSRKGNARVSLLQNTRVCYACSSVTEPNCWKPDKVTTVKYCRKGHNTCISKTIKSDNELIIVRDCGVSCEDNNFRDLIPKYESCSVCHTDFCNSAPIIGSNLILCFTIISVLKCIFLKG